MKRIFSLLLLTSLSINGFAKDDDVKSIRPIASFINHDTLTCKIGNDNKANQAFYDLLGILNPIVTNIDNINDKPYKLGKQWITGIQKLEINQIHQKIYTEDVIEKKKRIFINVKKYGVNFIEMGQFLAVENEGKGDEIGGNGYYFILTGKPKTNLAKLKILGLADDETDIFETPEQQTRLNCFITG